MTGLEKNVYGKGKEVLLYSPPLGNYTQIDKHSKTIIYYLHRTRLSDEFF